jgi:hypothetical protein
MAVTDSEILDFLFKEAKNSYSGVTLQFVPTVEGERGGYRAMRMHKIVGPKDTPREAVLALMQAQGALPS